MAARDDVPIASGMRKAAQPSRWDERLANLELAEPDVLVKMHVNGLQSSISQDGMKNGSLCGTTSNDLHRTQPVASVKNGTKRHPARAPAIARKGPRQQKRWKTR